MFTLRFLLVVIITVITSSCGIIIKKTIEAVDIVNNSFLFRQGLHGDLTEEEIEFAKVAWKYFQNNLNYNTSLVNYIDKKEIVSISSISDYIISLIAMNKLNLITDKEFHQKISNIISTLNIIKLDKNGLPYYYYKNNSNLSPITQKKNEIGLYIFDLSRLLLVLNLAKSLYSNYSEYIDKFFLRLNFCNLIDNCGVIYYENDIFKLPGYLSYSIKAFKLLNFDTSNFEKLFFKEYILIDNVKIYYEYPGIFEKEYKPPHFISPIPYIYEGIEFNWDVLNDKTSLDSFHTDLASYSNSKKIYDVQEKRFYDKKIFTSRGEYLDSNSDYVINSIFANGYSWNVLNSNNNFIPDKSLVSIKTAFGLHYLFNTKYTNNLFNLIKYSYDPNRGWIEGKFESNFYDNKVFTSSTNSMILEVLFYKKYGKIFSLKSNYSFYNLQNEDKFERNSKLCPYSIRKKCVEK